MHTTISADGRMVAALWNAGTKAQVVCVRDLEKGTHWRSINSPPLSQSIRFASQGHDLLLTYSTPISNQNVLARLETDRPDAEVIKTHAAEHLAFLVEISPCRVMVRTRGRSDPNNPKSHVFSGYYWIVVGPNGRVEKVGPESILPYPAPNIVGDGFFWMEQQMDETLEAHPLVLPFALPGGSIPKIERSRFEKNTHNVACDRSANRCLRWYVANRYERPVKPYIYDVAISLGPANCKVPGVSGNSDGVSITPDGSAGVFALTTARGRPRHVVVLRFQPSICEATIVQHIAFEER